MALATTFFKLDVQRQEMEREKEAARVLRRETEEARAKAAQYRDDLEKQRDAVRWQRHWTFRGSR